MFRGLIHSPDRADQRSSGSNDSEQIVDVEQPAVVTNQPRRDIAARL